MAFAESFDHAACLEMNPGREMVIAGDTNHSAVATLKLPMISVNQIVPLSMSSVDNHTSVPGRTALAMASTARQTCGFAARPTHEDFHELSIHRRISNPYAPNVIRQASAMQA